ncbi:hypothetical protein GCM10025886_05910 [Tetragenococcus halophilus subsp. flandriensis]|uniref:DUF6609 family protein n=1 Tax=Tetragenococcus halophilus TaxID=51669 RepID=UPI0023E99801|nr:DUF6609 family protein [Tetragenococcus halophilus]GMA07440.1 hypothetical protein GCM10025886_05910 [Tetragenococcus halophilus subsp. flandriensis]
MSSYRYNTQRVSGVWFLYIGVVIIISAIFGGNSIFNPYIFGFGFAIGYFLIFGLPFINNKLAYGKNTKFQDRMDNFTIIISLILVTLCGVLISFEDLRFLWLAVFIVMGLHFIGFYFSQGKIVLILGGLVTINGVLGLILPLVPFLIFAIIDGILKISFGIYMISLRRNNFQRQENVS